MAIENDTILSCDWSEFEDWIRQQIGGDFSWKIRPMDTEEFRAIIIESIKTTIRNNDGLFPKAGDMFIEK